MGKWFKVLVPAAVLLLSSVATAAPAPAAPIQAPASSPVEASFKPKGTIQDFLNTPDGQKKFGDEAVDASGDVGADILGCMGYSQLIYENGYTGGVGQATVLCDLQWQNYPPYQIQITVQVQRKRLQPNSSWVNYGQPKVENCTISYGRCRAEKPFLAGDPDPVYSYDYRIVTSATVGGTTRIDLPFRTETSRPFNRSGLPYPKVRVHPRDFVPFPTCTGPWTETTRRNDWLFRVNCEYYYQSNGWSWPEPMPGEQIERHHVWPLHWGGTNSGSNCYALSTGDHQDFTAFWAGHNP